VQGELDSTRPERRHAGLGLPRVAAEFADGPRPGLLELVATSSPSIGASVAAEVAPLPSPVEPMQDNVQPLAPEAAAQSIERGQPGWLSSLLAAASRDEPSEPEEPLRRSS
jgi:hypothetical protein